MSDFQPLLVEIGTEELPPKALPELAQALFDARTKGLAPRHLQFNAADGVTDDAPVTPPPATPGSPAELSDLELLRHYEPIVRFTRGEQFFPSDVDRYLQQCSLWAHYPDGREAELVPDGQLDEAIWATAPLQGNFIQREPRFGARASEKTEFRILYDDRNIYIAVWAWDSDPEGIPGSELKRDSGLRKGADTRSAATTVAPITGKPSMTAGKYTLARTFATIAETRMKATTPRRTTSMGGCASGSGRIGA